MTILNLDIEFIFTFDMIDFNPILIKNVLN